MNILECTYTEKTDYKWHFLFDVEDVDQYPIIIAKESDGEYYTESAFGFYVCYDGVTDEIIYSYLFYITETGEGWCFDYELTKEQREHVIKEMRKELYNA